jgi:hypothetical protein
MKQVIELIKQSLITEVSRYMDDIKNALDEHWGYQRVGQDPHSLNDWALVNAQNGRCVSASGLASLLNLLYNIKLSEDNNAMPLDTQECLVALRAVALNVKDPSDPAYIKAVTMLVDTCNMGLDQMLERR